MTISVSCICGKSFQAKDELAGRRVKCPNCGVQFVVPSRETHDNLSELFDEADMRPAPAPKKKKPKISKKFYLTAGIGLGLLVLAGIFVGVTMMIVNRTGVLDQFQPDASNVIARSDSVPGTDTIASLTDSTFSVSADWHDYESKEFQFRARFPFAPEPTVHDQLLIVGCARQGHSFFVSASRYNKVATNDSLNSWVTSRQQGVGVLSGMFAVSEASLIGYPGREIVSHDLINGEFLQKRIRRYRMGDLILEISWQGFLRTKPDFVDKFLDSLQYTGPAIATQEEPLGPLAQQYTMWTPNPTVSTAPPVIASPDNHDYSDWQVFESAEHRFRIRTPGLVEVKTEYDYVTHFNSPRFRLRVADMPAGAFPPDLMDHLARTGPGMPNTAVIHRGYAGRQMLLESQRYGHRGEKWLRIYLIDNDLYELVGWCPDGTEPCADLLKFFDSFEFLGPANTSAP